MKQYPILKTIVLKEIREKEKYKKEKKGAALGLLRAESTAASFALLQQDAEAPDAS